MSRFKVAVVGSGAIGGLFASWLGTNPNSDISLSVLARGDTLKALNSSGLRLIQGEKILSIPVNATDNSSSIGHQDLVILSVKEPSLAQVMPAVQSLIGLNTLLLVAMNGIPWWFFEKFGGPFSGLSLKSIDPQGVLSSSIPVDQIVGSVLHASARVEAPGVVRHIAGNRLIIGWANNRGSSGLTSLRDLLCASGWDASVSDCIQKNIWYKLWGNMTMNPVSAITGATCDQILDDPLTRNFCSAVMLEAQSIGHLIGCSIDETPEVRHEVTRKLGAFKTSMLQDVEAGRQLEINALVGVVREIGQRVGIATPNIDALLGLVRLMGEGRGLYSKVEPLG